VKYLNKVCCIFTTESVSEKKFENRLTFDEVMRNSLVSCFFLTHSVVTCNARAFFLAVDTLFL